MRFLGIALLAVAASASAQGTKTPATNPATKQNTKAPATSPATKQDTKLPATKAPATKAPAGQRAGLTIAPESTARAAVPVVMRETYDYDASGRRDPFFSLLSTAELRPAITDLKLTSVLFHPSRPVAILRDVATSTQYRVTLGTQLGRMRVVLIRPRVVIFTIEEFGLNRQDSLVLFDTSKARAR